MKRVILSADGDWMVYLVPDPVAAHLEEYCYEYCCRWLPDSPHAAQFRRDGVLYYTEADFIDYLNRWIFPDQPSFLVESLGRIDEDASLPERCRDCPQFHF